MLYRFKTIIYGLNNYNNPNSARSTGSGEKPKSDRSTGVATFLNSLCSPCILSSYSTHLVSWVAGFLPFVLEVL